MNDDSSERDQGEMQPSTPEQDEETLCPRIYVASLSDYNAGRLHGVWIDAWNDPEDIHDAIQAMLARSPEPGAEEWAIHDYEGFSLVPLTEFDPIESVQEIAHGIMEHGEAFAAWVAYAGRDEENLDPERFNEAYMGEWESFEAMAEDWLQECGVFTQIDDHISESLRPYVKVDIEQLARHMQIDMVSVPKPDGSGVWIFDPHRI